MSIFLLLLAQAHAVVRAQQAPLSASDRRAHEHAINEQRIASNGISVAAVKLYDDSLLQQMLRAAEAKLAAIQSLDQTGIASRVGALSGATQRISSVGISVQTPSLPGVVTTNKAATSNTVETTPNPSSDDAKPSSLTATNNAATHDVTTTAAAFSPPTATAPAATTTLPTTFSASASDVLNEQMQLTYEIANLRLLLEGALSDNVLVSGHDTFVKPRVTLGFETTIDAQKRFQDAVAVVEVEVDRSESLVADALPSITALLPRERTYNVAAITDSSMSIGGGVATSILGVSGSWLTGHKTYYITRDQDTVALTYQPTDPMKIGFRWQFRPVLGRHTLQSGLKQTFVQLAFPSAASAASFGTATVRSYWVAYDAKRATTGRIKPDTLVEYLPQPIRPLPLGAPPTAFNNALLQDLGNGSVLVEVRGRFLTGTYVRIGATMLRDGSPGVQFEDSAIRFTASIAELAAKQVALVARDGSEQRLSIGPEVVGAVGHGPVPVPTTGSATVVGLDDGNATLTVTVDQEVEHLLPLPLLVIGDRAFGYSDAPITRHGMQITATVPMPLLLSNPRVAVTSLFGPYHVEIPIQGLSPLSKSERLVLLQQGDKSSTYLLYGSRLSTIRVLDPPNVTPGSIGRLEDNETLRTLTLDNAESKSYKQLVLQRNGERPFLLAMPPGEKAPSVKAHERAVVDSDSAIFDVDQFNVAPTVTWNKHDLKAERLDGKTLRVSGLKSAGVTGSPTSQTLQFKFEMGNTTATLDVVNSRIETVVR
jgi:hypothetical protein